MATVKEPAEKPEAPTVKEPVEAPSQSVAEGSPNERVFVYDTNTGDKLRNPVPRSWLDGRFPNLSETPSSKKAGK